ncbi:MAG: hypothetical protein ACP5G7_03095 [Anaerolineae bacterium]
MFDIVTSLFEFVDQHALWLYLACALVALYYLRQYFLAHRERTSTIFTIEKEVAVHRQGKAMSGIGIALGIAAVIAAVKYYVVPNVDISQLTPPTPTITFTPPTRQPPTPTATPVTPTTTPRPRPTTAPVATVQISTLTPTPPVAVCSNPDVCITSPTANEILSGNVSIIGTARADRFQFYKIEYAAGENPTEWNVYGELHYQPITDGTLATFDASALPDGVYWLQLVVVDETGNFAPPHRVRVIIQKS